MSLSPQHHLGSIVLELVTFKNQEVLKIHKNKLLFLNQIYFENIAPSQLVISLDSGAQKSITLNASRSLSSRLFSHQCYHSLRYNVNGTKRCHDDTVSTSLSV